MNRYLQGIKDSRNDILTEIYNNNYPPLRNFVIQNNGTEVQAQDVFQDVMVALYKRLQKEDIELTNSFNVYIFSIGKFTWFHHLKKISKDRALVSKETKIDYEPDIDEEFRFRLYEKHFNQLGEDCKKVLGYYFEKIPFLEVAELMGYKSEDFARRKKYLCKNQLKKMILNDPIYKEV